jgi:hypothetical protein
MVFDFEAATERGLLAAFGCSLDLGFTTGRA